MKQRQLDPKRLWAVGDTVAAAPAASGRPEDSSDGNNDWLKTVTDEVPNYLTAYKSNTS